jgi:hypothetical protein
MHARWTADHTGLELLRFLYGAGQLLAPASMARSVGANTDDTALLVRRILGARHLVQAMVLARRGPTAHRLGAAVDATHALSMVILAIVDHRHRADALLNGLSATAFAFGEVTR